MKIVASFLESSHPKIVYPVALTAWAGADTGASFLEFLKGQAAKAIFQRNGFIVLPR